MNLIVLVDSTKFANRSSLVLCPLDRIDTIITDEGIDDRTAAMLEAADVTLIVVPVGAAQKEGVASLASPDCNHSREETMSVLKKLHRIGRTGSRDVGDPSRGTGRCAHRACRQSAWHRLL